MLAILVYVFTYISSIYSSVNMFKVTIKFQIVVRLRLNLFKKKLMYFYILFVNASCYFLSTITYEIV